MFSTSSNGTGAYAPANWVALSSDTNPPLAGDGPLPGEITSGTLSRAQGSYAHTNGTNTATVTKTFTSDQAVTVNKMGLYTAGPTGGTLAFSDIIDPSVLRNGDALTVSNVVTI